jgi:hypothetical protein
MNKFFDFLFKFPINNIYYNYIQSGKDNSDICSILSNVSGIFWNKHTNHCNILIQKDINKFKSLAYSMLYLYVLFKIIGWIIKMHFIVAKTIILRKIKNKKN